MNAYKTNRKGFSLVELLVVMAIISVIAGAIMGSLRAAKQKAFIARVKADGSQLRTAVQQLESETTELPNHLPGVPCTQNAASVLLDTSAAVGLSATDGNFSKWNGPYLSGIPNDPWLTPYRLNKWSECNGQEGCQGIADGTRVRAIVSYGPNKIEENGGDDILTVICK